MRLQNFLYYFINFVTLWNLIMSKDMPTNYSSKYGEGYGKEWIYFPDGDGIPHYVSLIGGDEVYPLARGGFNDIEYRLYVRSNLTDSILLNDTAEPVLNIDDDFELSKLPLKIITHGWRSSVESDAVTGIKYAYLQRQGVNVITVDWSYIANSILYHWVANQTEIIGVEIATFLDALSARYNVSGENVHLVGHSLGAHIMGIAAFHSKLAINRITGLDPARPLFEYPSRNESGKLDANDASFVDIIHTCSGVLGIESNVGTVDFFPNSGIPPQPGCETIPKILGVPNESHCYRIWCDSLGTHHAYLRLHWDCPTGQCRRSQVSLLPYCLVSLVRSHTECMILIKACSHGRSYYYFAESIGTPKAFPSYQCSNWTQYLENRCVHSVFMGEEVNRNITGKFYLKTNPKYPFGRRNN